MGEPPLLPRYSLPPALDIPRVTLDQPKALIPSYRPLVVPPSDLRAPPGVSAEGGEQKSKEENQKQQSPEISLPKEVTSFTIPFTDYQVPVPKQEILVAAGTTASVSVVATDISKEDSDVQSICNAAWTDQVKADYKALLIAQKSS